MHRQRADEMIRWNVHVEQVGGEPTIESEEPAFVKAIDEARDGGALVVIVNLGKNRVDGSGAASNNSVVSRSNGR